MASTYTAFGKEPPRRGVHLPMGLLGKKHILWHTDRFPDPPRSERLHVRPVHLPIRRCRTEIRAEPSARGAYFVGTTRTRVTTRTATWQARCRGVGSRASWRLSCRAWLRPKKLPELAPCGRPLEPPYCPVLGTPGGRVGVCPMIVSGQDPKEDVSDWCDRLVRARVSTAFCEFDPRNGLHGGGQSRSSAVTER